MRLVSKNYLLHLIYHTAVSYGAPTNLTYFWNFGVLSGLCLVIQIITGIFLAMHYVPHSDLAFLSVEYIMRDVQYGWLIRYIHSNGASFFFLVVYIHIFRGLFYGSYIYPRELLWVSGVLIFLLMILTAFLGYVLPWGQMSFWAATVITNLASAIPGIGNAIVVWLWGGFSVDNATLNRFFSLHYLFPFIILALVILHIYFLHQYGSNNPLGILGGSVDNMSKRVDNKGMFTPYYTIKDLYSIIIFLMVMGYFVFWEPNTLGHPDNYIPANPMSTPAHIVPEWYFLPFYAMLRSIPDKLGGVVVMLMSIIILFLLPFLYTQNIRSNDFRPLNKIFFWFFVGNYLILGWIGGNAVETPFYEIGQISTFFYFFYFLGLLPFSIYIENMYIFGHYNKYSKLKNFFNKFK